MLHTQKTIIPQVKYVSDRYVNIANANSRTFHCKTNKPDCLTPDQLVRSNEINNVTDKFTTKYVNIVR